LRIGAAALEDTGWAQATRARLADDARQLDRNLRAAGAQVLGGTDLFRLARVPDAAAWQDRLAQARIWTRVFPHDTGLIRLGLPAPQVWPRVEAAL
jgi:cobalamin biosynthetic protein CobC